MKLEGQTDVLRALEHKICNVTCSSAECYTFEKLMIQSLKMPSHLLMETTATVREMKSASVFCVLHSQFFSMFHPIFVCKNFQQTRTVFEAKLKFI